jgi:hypothetical protein
MPIEDQLEKAYKQQEKTQRKLARQKETCHTCGEKIVGKAFIIDQEKGWYACSRCNNEKPAQ